MADGGDIAIICADDGQSDAFTPILTGENGDNFAWVITMANGTILAIPPGPPFNLEGAGAGYCFIYHIAYNDGFTGEVLEGANICQYTEDNGCFSISNHITVNRQTGEDCDDMVCDALSSTITFPDGTTNTSICVDGVADPLEVVMSGDFSGDNSTFIIASDDGTILDIPAGQGPFNLDGAGPGTCVIWYISYGNDLTGLTVGENVNGLAGCFDLSNGLVVLRQEADGGTVNTADGETEVIACAGEVIIDVRHQTTASALSYWYVITDAEDNILEAVNSFNNSTLDLSAAPPGECHIWGWSYRGEPTPLAGENISTLADGDCEAISDNFIRVVRLGADAGAIALDGGAVETTICVDDAGDPLSVIMSGDVAGDNSTFFITDNASGEILGVPGDNGPFDLNGAGVGVCDIWYLSSFGDVEGLAMGGNIADLDGCFDLSNPITVTRLATDGGAIALADGSTEVTICVDGEGDPLEVIRDGNSTGTNRTFVITNAISGEILGIPGTNGPFDLNGAGPGVCEIWYLAYEDGLNGLETGANIADLDGCFDLSNAITVTRNEPKAGEISLTDGSIATSICVDDLPDPLAVEMSGISLGDNTTFFITDANTGEILGIPGNNGPFDLNGAGQGICEIWYLSAFGEVSGLAMGGNIADLDGCFDLSNAITVTRNQAEAGAIALEGGETSTTICVDDMADPLAVIMSGNVAGDNSTFFITDNATGEILGVPGNNGPFDLNGAGPGTCDIWYLSAFGEVSGLTMGGNIADLDGCFDLSNAITVTRNQAEAGAIALEDGETSTTICIEDMADPLAVIMSGNVAGDNSTFFITDNATGEILGVPGNNGPFDLNGAGPGTCDIWYLSAYGEVSGLSMGGNIADLDGCFDLSNAITVTRLAGEDCMAACEANGGGITLAEGAIGTTICVDGTGDPLEIIRDGNGVGTNRTFIITNAITGEILGIPDTNGPFDLDGAGPGTCDIWYLAYEDGLTGLAMGGNIADLDGCFDLSNAITVTRNQAEAGAIALEGGETSTTICVDDMADPLAVIMSGNVAGDNSTFFITDNATGEILGVPGNNGPFDLNGAGVGVCDIWYLSAYGEVSGLSMGGNIADLDGCFDLSNAITVTRNTGDDCGSGFTFDNVVLNEVTADGMIELFNGTDRQINVADFWLCNRPQYQQISNLQLECGNLLMEPGDITVVSGFSGFNSTDAELGLYTINSFGDTAAIVSYLEWGSSGHGRSGTAIQAGIWTANFFVSPPNANESLQLSVNGSSELEWNLAATSVCNPNNATTPTGGPSTEAQVSIFPNPVSGNRLNVMLEGMQGEMMQLQVFDMNGRQLQLLTSEMENGPVEIQLPAAPAGTYFLRVVNNGRVITERFTRF